MTSPTFNEAPSLLHSGLGARLQRWHVWARALAFQERNSNFRCSWLPVLLLLFCWISICGTLRKRQVKGQDKLF